MHVYKLIKKEPSARASCVQRNKQEVNTQQSEQASEIQKENFNNKINKNT
jgi:hypothetical protein